MKVDDPKFVLDRFEKYLEGNIFPSRIRQRQSIEEWKYIETDSDHMLNGAEKRSFDTSEWQDYKLYDPWGGYDKVAWFKAGIDVPAAWRNQALALRFLPGPRDGGESTAEALLYVNEKPVQGIDIWHEEAILDEDLRQEAHLDIALKIWSGVLGVPKHRIFKEAELIILDEKVDQFYYICKTLCEVARTLDQGSLTHIAIKKALVKAFYEVSFLNLYEDDYYESVYKALDSITESLEELGRYDELKPRVYGVGHSHIDMAWLWRLNATREKASRTFSTVLNLMKQYPEYKFMHSSPQLYKFLEEDHPEIFASVKERIQSGEWEITGGMWVESDTYIPSGESLVRQFLHGKNYIKETFDKETHLLWLPDVFGYSGALPQIIKKSGLSYFMTTKISWNEYNHFPYDTFMWEGIDGSQVLTHFITTPENGSWFYTYNGKMSPDDIQGVWKNYKDKDINDRLLIAYGWGDGGGGPTREMLESMRVMKNLPGVPYVETSGAEEYFDNLNAHLDKDNIRKWVGELYFEYHRGTLTSQAKNKRYNRKSEILLHNIEASSVLLQSLDPNYVYPKDIMDAMWERVLLNQFHDILPGSSIKEVYEDTTKDYELIKSQGNTLLEDNLKKLAMQVAVSEKNVVIFNLTGLKRTDYITIPYSNQITKNARLMTQDGDILSSVAVDEGLLVYAENLLSYGYCVLNITEAKEEPRPSAFSFDGQKLESPYYTLTFNETGEISYLFDKLNERLVSDSLPMNSLRAFEDKPLRFDAWDINIFYKDKAYEGFKLESSEVIEDSAERFIIRQVRSFNKSTIVQDIVFYAHSGRIDFKTRVDWHEHQVLLRTYFPVKVRSDQATFEIQYGHVQRPTHRNTEYDMAKFEVSGHRYCDLSDTAYGVALLNDCKYGWDVQDNVIGLSLIKSAIAPDPQADQGEHLFTYSLLPHNGSFEESLVQEEAIKLNMPLLHIESETDTFVETKTPDDTFFVRTGQPNVLIDTLKPAEDGQGYIVRCYEYLNQAIDHVDLEFSKPVSRVSWCNLMEEAEKDLDIEENCVHFPLGNFEIATLRVLFEDNKSAD